jgi:hypothetical protein
VTGKELEIKGVQDVQFHLGGKKFIYQFCICSLPTEAGGILGVDILAGKKALINLEKSQFRLLSGTERRNGFESQRTRQVKGKTSHGALTVFCDETGKVVAKNQLRKSGKSRKSAVRKVSIAP